MAAPSSPSSSSSSSSVVAKRSLGKVTLGDFELLATLGTGTFGRVRLVKHKSTGQFFAMKILKKVEIVRLKQVDHILSEKSVLDQLDCPFIVRLFAAFQDDKKLYMVMEYVPGGELFSYLRNAGRFPQDVARFYAAQIVLAWEYMHKRYIIYRDLKPENVLIDSTGHLRIADFGFAKKVEDRTWTLCGTPEYLAPEIIQGRGHGKAADWWTLGVLLFEMLVGYTPFYDVDQMGTYQRILAGRIAFPSHVSADAKDLIRRLLSADVTKRFGNLRAGANDVKNHKFFAGVDWEKMMHKNYRAPFIPPIKGADDTSNFEKYAESIDDPRGPKLDRKLATELFKSF
eukprot:TRINITY_DN13154_c0_g2_i1.p1 TRINITY_DN13154_c0_g2~~TRINITY_DN13154_c0_g2_i1.p1  ORF type:complete len:374 (-),score=97.59 TRINITY_DN13154_c0_g2_i1:117-1142(-)